MRAARQLGTALSVVLAFAGCRAIIGYDDVVVVDASTSDALAGDAGDASDAAVPCDDTVDGAFYWQCAGGGRERCVDGRLQTEACSCVKGSNPSVASQAFRLDDYCTCEAGTDWSCPSSAKAGSCATGQLSQSLSFQVTRECACSSPFCDSTLMLGVTKLVAQNIAWEGAVYELGGARRHFQRDPPKQSDAVVAGAIQYPMWLAAAMYVDPSFPLADYTTMLTTSDETKANELTNLGQWRDPPPDGGEWFQRRLNTFFWSNVGLRYTTFCGAGSLTSGTRCQASIANDAGAFENAVVAEDLAYFMAVLDSGNLLGRARSDALLAKMIPTSVKPVTDALFGNAFDAIAEQTGSTPLGSYSVMARVRTASGSYALGITTKPSGGLDAGAIFAAQQKLVRDFVCLVHQAVTGAACK